MMAPFEDEVAPYRFEELQATGKVTLRPRPLNWKTIADNYSDHLHIPIGHPGLTRLFGRNYRISAHAHVDRMEGDLVEQPSANPSERAYQKLLPAASTCPQHISASGSITSCFRISRSTSIPTRSTSCSSFRSARPRP